MTPGTYLRKRREAAGLSIQAVAAFLYGRHAMSFLRTHSLDSLTPAGMILSLERFVSDRERDDPLFDAGLVGMLSGCFPFDPAVYQQLLFLHEGADCLEPRVCRECACSWNDACRNGPAHPGCAWSDTDPTICTACEARAAAKGEKP